MPHTIVGLVGSLRRASLNRALLRAAGKYLPEGFAISEVPIGELPLYNGDLDAGAIASVTALNEAIGASAGVLIATPEYNYGIPGPLKNAIDWASRPAYQSVFATRPVGILTASPGPYGGARAQGQLKQVLLGMASRVYPSAELAVGGAALGDDGAIVMNERHTSRLERYVQGFAEFAGSTLVG